VVSAAFPGPVTAELPEHEGPIPMRVGWFLGELKRRRVFRVALVYLAAAWVMIEVADTIFPYFDLPAWSVRLVISVVAVGFPFALVFGWVFDVTPTGVHRTPARPSEASPGALGPAVGWAAAGIFMLLLLMAGALSLWPGSRSSTDAGPAPPDLRTLAVLPFGNMSDEPGSEHFTDGIHEEVIAQLAGVADLSVISRTSVMEYKGVARNLRRVGQELGVGVVLEGSVRRADNRVRVTVQLIDARTDAHLWANTYDAELADVFAIQSQIARSIVDALEARLTGEERARMDRVPTRDAEAYALYLAASEHRSRAALFGGEAAVRREIELYEAAIRLDPDFALARAWLARAYCSLVWFNVGDPGASRARGRQEAERALALAPGLPEAHLAVGYYHYQCARDYDQALQAFLTALGMRPSDADGQAALAFVLRRQGRWQESIPYLRRALELAPRRPGLYANLGLSYEALRRYPEALHVYDTALGLMPDSLRFRLRRAVILLHWRGEPDSLRAIVREAPPTEQVSNRYLLARLDRNWEEALAALAVAPPERSTLLLRGTTYAALGDPARALAHADSALPLYDAWVREFPDAIGAYDGLSVALNLLGRDVESVEVTRHARGRARAMGDAWLEAEAVLNAAAAFARVGEADSALALLERAVRMPVPVVGYPVPRDPVWDRLREDPLFRFIARQWQEPL
jgi:TolB-like protein